MGIRMVVRLVIFLLAVTFLSSAVWAQGTSGIAGVVKDTTGAVLPGVTVEVASPVLIEKVRSAVTDDQGAYRIVNLLPGTYTVTFTLTGFSTVKREGIALTSNFTAAVDADLRVGSIEETVTVSGQSPIIDVENVVRQRVISREVLDSLPTNREFSAFASITVGAVLAANQQDVGGNKDPILAFVSIHGSRSRDGRQLIDGMNFNGEGAGRGFYFNPAAASEVSLELGGQSSERELGSVQANLVPKEGGNKFSGSFFSNYTNKHMKSDNLTDELRARGLSSVNTTEWLYEVNGAIGGPVVRDKLWFFTHHRFWGFKNPVAGNYYSSTPGTLVYTPDLSRPAYVDQINRGHGLRMTWQASARNKINVGFDLQNNCLCHNGQTAIISPDAAYKTVYGLPLTLTQLKWNFPLNNRVLLEAGSSTLLFNWPNYRLPESFGAIRVMDSARNYTWGAPAIPSLGIRIAHQTNERASLTYVTGAHSFKTGFTVEMGWHDHIWDPYGTGGKEVPALPLDYGYFNGVPNFLTLYATPVRLQERLKANLGLFAQDQWTIQNFTLNLGLRFDYFNGFVPETRLAAGPFVPERDFARVDCVPCWKDINPRLGLAWNVFGTGKTALKAGIGRYVEADRYYTQRDNNPVQTSVNTTTRTWTDLNQNLLPDCDLANPLANGECRQVANLNFGKTNPAAATFASDVLTGLSVRPYMWQMSLGIQHQVWQGVAAEFGYFRTWYGNWRATENVAVTPADYDYYTFVAPIDPRLPNGGGYPVPGLYDVKPAKFGQVTSVTSQSSNYGRQSEVYNGFDFLVNARLSRGMVSGGLNIGRQIFDNCDVRLTRPNVGQALNTAAVFLNTTNFNDWPLTTAFCNGARPWDKQLKFQGMFTLGWGLQTSATYQNLPGIAIFSTMTASAAQVAPYLGRIPSSGGTTRIELIEPYTQFEDRITQLDWRLSKVFRMGTTRVEPILDVYNVLNSSSILTINTTYGPTWLRPTEVLLGRAVKIGAQIIF